PCPRSGARRNSWRLTGCGRCSRTLPNLTSSSARSVTVGSCPKNPASALRSWRVKRAETSSSPGNRPRRLRSWLVRSNARTPPRGPPAPAPAGMAPSATPFSRAFTSSGDRIGSAIGALLDDELGEVDRLHQVLVQRAVHAVDDLVAQHGLALGRAHLGER